MKRWVNSICFPALSLQVLSLPLYLPVWLRLDGQNFQLERGHFEVCSSLADLVGSSGIKIGFLEDAWKKSTFPQFGREVLFWLSFPSYFLTCPLLVLSCHISKHWTLTSMSTTLLPLTSSLSVTCGLWGEVIRWAVGHSDQQPWAWP